MSAYSAAYLVGAAGAAVVLLLVASGAGLSALDADADAVMGGGADSLAFSALASSSLPRSTHILSCAQAAVSCRNVVRHAECTLKSKVIAKPLLGRVVAVQRCIDQTTTRQRPSHLFVVIHLVGHAQRRLLVHHSLAILADLRAEP